MNGYPGSGLIRSLAHYRYPRSLAEIFVVCGLIAIQEPTPAAYVIHQDLIEVSRSGFDYTKQFLQSLALLDRCSAFSLIDECADNADIVRSGVKSNCGRLIRD